jgi:outer membrane receptor protein involved in Fe transport
MKLSISTYLIIVISSSVTFADDNKPLGPIHESYLELMPIDKFIDVLSLDDLHNIVVTDAKVAQAKESVTQKILVMNDAEFERLTDYNRNIAELLRYSAGQYVNVLSRNDANWGSHSGLGPKYNTYMVDGLPIDSFADSMSLDAWAFERVETQRGPASVLYSNYMTMDFAGNETALAGTTNFILKERIDTSMTRAQFGFGSFDTYSGRVFHQDRNRTTSYFIGASMEQSDYTQYGQLGSWLQTVEKPNYKKSKIYGKLNWNFEQSESKLSMFVHHAEHNGDLGRPSRDYEHSYNTVNLNYSNQLSNTVNLNVKTGYRNYDRLFENDNFDSNLSLRNTTTTKQRIVPVDATVSYRYGDNHLLTMGSDAQWAWYETETIDATGINTPNNDVKARSLGIFIQDKWQLEQWVFRAGLRYNYIRHEYDLLSSIVPLEHSASWRKSLWSIGARYNITEHLSIYANSGSSFMVPSAKQSGGTVSSADDSGQLPNPSLDPESGIGNDFGIDYHPTPSINIGVRGFYNKISDAIVDNVVSLSPSQTMSINAGKAVAMGIEIDFHDRSYEKVEWFTNLTYSDTEIDNPADSDSDAADITFVPEYVFNAGLTSKLPWDVTLSPYYQWVGTYYDSTSKSTRSAFGRYGIFNIKLQKTLKRSRDYSANFLLELNNVTDKQYDMPWNFADPGFNGYAAFQIIY